MRTLFSRLSIGTRLHMATATALLTAAALLAAAQFYEARRMREARVALLHAVVDAAISITAGYEAEAKSGRITDAAARQAAIQAIRALRYQGAEYVWINDMQPRMVMHPARPELDGRELGAMADPTGLRLFMAFVDIVRAQGGGLVAYMWPRPGAEQPVPKLSYVRGFAPWGWVVGTGVYVDDLDAAERRLAVLLGGVGLVALAAIGGTIWLLGRGVSQPLAALTRATGAISAGQLDGEIPGLGRGDELGALAQALATLRDAARERVRLAAEVARRHAADGRRHAAMQRHTDDFGRSISGVLAELQSASAGMRAAADTMAAQAQETSRRAGTTAQGASESAGNLVATAGAVEQMSASIGEISVQAGNASSAVRAAIDSAAATDAKVRGMEAAAERIGGVVQMITDIAARTNLLALNATIEAARAGEAGRGFAVVAGEVKSLAAQTAHATGEIGNQVTGIRLAMEEAVEASRRANAAIGEIGAVAAAIAAAVEQQGAAMREVSGTIGAITATTSAASEAMQTVSGLADDADAGSRSVMATAAALAGTAGTLRSEVDHFLDAMARGGEQELRRYERIPGNGTRAMVELAGGARAEAVLADISRGGAALDFAATAAAGSRLTVALPGLPPIPARVVRTGPDRLAVAFAQDPDTLAAADRAIARIAGERNSLAA